MSVPLEHRVRVRGDDVRVWEKGEGRPLGVLAGILGFGRWTPFLEALSQRRKVVVPSLPGHPGGADFRKLDDLADWVTATLDLLERTELEGQDLVGLGPGATLAAEAAAFSPASVGQLALVAPFGLFDEAEPVTDFWARRISEIPATYSARPESFVREAMACPNGEDEAEWQISQVRAMEAAARMLWPTGDRGLSKRLHRIRANTVLVWGSEDAIVPVSYAKRFAQGLQRARSETHTIDGAGHRVDVDAPEELAEVILQFLG